MASPIKFAHIVFKTSRFNEMVTWWKDFLEADVRHGNDFICFLSYDDEHHRIAIVNFPNLVDRAPEINGVEHCAFTYDSLESLFGQYERMKSKGISPYWTINHGMTLSAYYRDPDGNQVETQYDSMSPTDADLFMNGSAFAANPIGIDVDFDSLIQRHRSGESESSIIEYVPTAR